MTLQTETIVILTECRDTHLHSLDHLLLLISDEDEVLETGNRQHGSGHFAIITRKEN